MSRPLEFHLTDMQDFHGCAHRFELTTMRETAPEFRRPETINGTAIHRTIQLIHSMSLWDASRSTIAAAYSAAWSGAIESPKREEERGVPIAWGEYVDAYTALAALAADALAMIDGYRRDVRNRDAAVVRSEAIWRGILSGETWTGTIDQIRLLSDGRAWIVDVKSGQEKIGDPALKLWMQGLGYALAVETASFPLRSGEWAPLGLEVAKVSWLHLRDYVPYERSGKAPKSGREYRKGEQRGPAFYTIDVTPEARASVLREMKLFTESVRAGRFPRQPSTYQCNRCSVRESCLLGFYGSIAGLEGIDRKSLPFEEARS